MTALYLVTWLLGGPPIVINSAADAEDKFREEGVWHSPLRIKTVSAAARPPLLPGGQGLFLSGATPLGDPLPPRADTTTVCFVVRHWM